ncbi:2-oxoglutarate/2-oxoacid ferredoxin oxidoreductase, gamma subunit / 2-oxoglutarate/2-oxoacid ferredoxin oxidoreductase, alpha subunit [hydrothermal vent metagenome]|uniref:2-oxoglutarate/2-oxoacid ferredoxin oxidoreductase, gamma subunit / 2-oxoglutarate/2-oxoacid ferredoxin oxidoreductase, alpha subunit n=1 Tax=hydrothermal vent metagenome TaxID=652676 RepID=A0A3B0UA98_9ZZZZ
MTKDGNGTDIQIAICGSAGDGTIASGDIMKRAAALMGYKVIAFDIYPPEIRGFGKCISRIRISSEQTYSLKHKSDILISLNDAHAIPHVGEVRDFGAVIYEDSLIAPVAEGGHISGHIKPAQVPYAISIRQISEQATNSARSRNIVILGFIAGLYDLPADIFHKVIAAKFATKAQIVIDDNTKAFDAGFKVGKQTFKLDDVSVGALREGTNGADAVMMTGNGAVVRGFLEGGIQAYFGYPITPATSIMERLAVEMAPRGGRFLQTEDEIAAIAATIGAAYAGSRAATATSGPGLALMGEMLGLGVMAEIPVVVVVSQRGGPSTGLPTKTEQSDLNLALYGGSGDAKRIVLAPTNVEGCYRCAAMAFEIAQTYQSPVILLIDLYLSNRYETVIPSKENAFSPKERVKPEIEKGKAYKRFEFSENNISERALPGDAGLMHTITGLEHNEFGRPNDAIHMKMSTKRHKKLDGAVKYPGLTVCKRFGDTGKVDVGILGWGSTFGEILETMFEAQDEGIKCSAMKVVMLSPLPLEEIKAFFADCREILVPELNYEGQFAQLISGALGKPVTRFSRVTGSPMVIEEILDQVRRLAKTGSKGKSASKQAGAQK